MSIQEGALTRSSELERDKSHMTADEKSAIIGIAMSELDLPRFRL